MNMKHILILCGLLAYPTQSWSTAIYSQTYGEARVGIHTFSGSGVPVTGVNWDVRSVIVMPHNVELQKIHCTLEPSGLTSCYEEPYFHEASSTIKSLTASAHVQILFDVDEHSISTVQLKLPSGNMAQYDVLPVGS